MKIAIRFRAIRTRSGKTAILPLLDETVIELPEVETVETMRYKHYSIEIDSKKLIIEDYNEDKN
jgi:hypothetical protein